MDSLGGILTNNSKIPPSFFELLYLLEREKNKGKVIDLLKYFEKYEEEIEIFQNFRKKTRTTVNEGNLEEFARKYIKIIELFWEAFFEKVLKRKYERVGVVVVSEKDLLPKYKEIGFEIAYHSLSNTIIIVKERFLSDLSHIIEGDAGIILAFAHEIGHAVQTQLGLQDIQTIEQENNADFFAGFVARILYEKGIFNDEDIEDGENSFFNLGILGCVETHGTGEERRRQFLNGFYEGKNFVDII